MDQVTGTIQAVLCHMDRSSGSGDRYEHLYVDRLKVSSDRYEHLYVDR